MVIYIFYTVIYPMELTGLKVFAAVVENKTATMAAKVLGMTQPGVSKHLGQLERDLGGLLFTRMGKYLVLNEFGGFFYEKVKKVLAEIRELSGLRYGSASPIGLLKLGLTDAATLVITPPSLIEFRKRYPGVHISLDVDSSARIEDGVLDGNYDVGIVTARAEAHPNLEEEVLYTDSIDAMVSAGHSLARRKFVQLKELADYPLIISPKRRRTRIIIDEIFASQGVKISDTIDVYMHTAAARLAESGLGVALLPRKFIREQLSYRKCVSIRIAGDPIRRSLCVLRKKGQDVSDAVAMFYSMIIEKSRHMHY